MIVYKCDLCGEIKECFQRDIEQKQYDICAECWEALEVKLRGKGRAKKVRETVLLPLGGPQRPGERTKPMPGEPPKIWGGSDRPN